MEMRRVWDTVDMIVQLPLDCVPEEYDDEPPHYVLLRILQSLFENSGLGTVDGSDRDGGKINIFIYEIAEGNWTPALAVVLKELEREKLLDVAVVARKISWESDNDARVDYTVFWPKNYDQEFSIW
jgi:hypothetical protein